MKLPSVWRPENGSEVQESKLPRVVAVLAGAAPR